MRRDRDRRVRELLVDRATQGLAPWQEAELRRQLGGESELFYEGIESAAAAAELALMGPEGPLPEHLRRRVAAAAESFFSGVGPQTPSEGRVMPFEERPAAAAKRRPAWGWWAAAAGWVAALALAWTQLDTLSAPVRAPAEPTPAERLAALRGKAADLVELPWQATEDPAALGAAGSVVWSSELQEGYMRFAGLAPNDPSASQYQLWIFDSTRDERYPVDGGVFDIPTEAGEVVVPIDPSVHVSAPHLFAVTVEPPGGVVVSSRERIALLAQPRSG